MIFRLPPQAMACLLLVLLGLAVSPAHATTNDDPSASLTSSESPDNSTASRPPPPAPPSDDTPPPTAEEMPPAAPPVEGTPSTNGPPPDDGDAPSPDVTSEPASTPMPEVGPAPPPKSLTKRRSTLKRRVAALEQFIAELAALSDRVAVLEAEAVRKAALADLEVRIDNLADLSEVLEAQGGQLEDLVGEFAADNQTLRERLTKLEAAMDTRLRTSTRTPSTSERSPELPPPQSKSKAVFYHFWSTYCQPCLADLPAVARTSRALQAQGVEVRFIAEEDESTKSRATAVFEQRDAGGLPLTTVVGVAPQRRSLGLNRSDLPVSVLTIGGMTRFIRVGVLRGADQAIMLMCIQHPPTHGRCK
jgi:thiol-disulfide isomerase/thioredoxin